MNASTTIYFSAERLRQIETEALAAGDVRGAILACRLLGDSVKVIAARRGMGVGHAQAEREIRSLLSPEECRGQKACLVAMLEAYPRILKHTDTYRLARSPRCEMMWQPKTEKTNMQNTAVVATEKTENEATETMAEMLARNLNEYDGPNFWEDVVASYPLDHKAIDDADRSYRSDIVILKDGSIVAHDESTKEWTIIRQGNDGF